MAQLEHIEAIEKGLWTAADTLRANLQLVQARDLLLPRLMNGEIAV